MSGRATRLPAAALFDWDGTIVDTLPLIYRSNVIALRHLGIEMSREWFRERYTPDWRRSYRELGVPEDRWDEVAGLWAAAMRSGRPRALPWARGALRRLRGAGVRVGLVTASTRDVVAPSLARLNLEDVFEVAYYSDDVVRSKPHPEALDRALGDLGVEPAEAVYVGDTIVDLEMAGAAGVPFVAVAGVTPPAVFRDAGAGRVWPGVGAWASELLGPVRRDARADTPRRVSGGSGGAR